MRFVLAPLFALAAFANGRCLARDSAGRYVRDSAQPDSAFRGPHYRFTGQEDSTLLAAIFAKTFQLGKEDAGGLARPSAFCISIGRGQQTDAPPSVLRLLSTHQPRVVAASACEVNAKGNTVHAFWGTAAPGMLRPRNTPSYGRVLRNLETEWWVRVRVPNRSVGWVNMTQVGSVRGPDACSQGN